MEIHKINVNPFGSRWIRLEVFCKWWGVIFDLENSGFGQMSFLCYIHTTWWLVWSDLKKKKPVCFPSKSLFRGWLLPEEKVHAFQRNLPTSSNPEKKNKQSFCMNRNIQYKTQYFHVMRRVWSICTSERVSGVAMKKQRIMSENIRTGNLIVKCICML